MRVCLLLAAVRLALGSTREVATNVPEIAQSETGEHRTNSTNGSASNPLRVVTEQPTSRAGSPPSYDNATGLPTYEQAVPGDAIRVLAKEMSIIRHKKRNRELLKMCDKCTACMCNAVLYVACAACVATMCAPSLNVPICSGFVCQDAAVGCVLCQLCLRCHSCGDGCNCSSSATTA